jgi:hypothetical protein
LGASVVAWEVLQKGSKAEPSNKKNKKRWESGAVMNPHIGRWIIMR